ncbi:MAG: hypothetical protein HQK56_12095 [Deltaproteobacteria bacterium]|nr:hypothetical protein [Deltaproteobacteria bacterium]
MTQEWFRAATAANYSGVSNRTLRSWLNQGLRHSRVSRGTVLVKREWLDEFLTKFECQTNRVDEIVDDVMADLGTRKRGRQS